MVEQPNAPRFKIVANPKADPELLARFAARMAEEAANTPPGEDLFPKTRREANCRVCGELREMTEEHIPPRGAGNKQRGRNLPVDEVLEHEELDLPDDMGVPVQGGIRGYVLCGACQNTTSRWGREYKAWARAFMALLGSQPKKPNEIDEEPGYLMFGSVPLENVYPGRLVRQALSMMLSVSGSSELAEKFPALRRLVLGGEPEPLPPPLRLYFLLYGSSNGRFAGGPRGQVHYDGTEEVERRLLSVDFPPLAFVLLLDGPPTDLIGVDISHFTEWPPDDKGEVELRELPLGFGNKLWPGEYRSKGQMRADGDDPDDA